jgi:hypothetical protein
VKLRIDFVGEYFAVPLPRIKGRRVFCATAPEGEGMI